MSYFIFDIIRWGSYYEDYWYSFKSNLVTFSLGMLLVYFNIYFLFPKFILKKKYKKYILFFLLTLCVFYVVRTELIYLLINKNVWPESDSLQSAYSFNHIVVVFLTGIYDVALVTTIKLTADWIYERKRVEDLQKVQLRTELDFLKAQIQPHFFFNTLNNLYALTLEKSEAAPSVVLKLSDIMQYVLYDAKEPLISLFKEINYIQSYLDLERLRYGDNVISRTDVVGNIEGTKVPPLIFLPFVENCFKHGAKNNDNLEVNISFENVLDKWLIFKVENTFNQLNDSDLKHGIGNQNVNRRLELLFPNNFDFKTTIEENNYCIQLKIPIYEN
ncbi:histidine kinase [Lutibacter profundi]|uniref:Histidine kinase n=1 Tax=Lutibacter profundi TaxID=1622118 RepID=A0A0X8G8Z5_9FLAO|nr:histidine kinase [Lutibacter profundi]